jgi:hypothetical protein
MGSYSVPSTKGDDEFITPRFLQQSPLNWHKVVTQDKPAAMRNRLDG